MTACTPMLSSDVQTATPVKLSQLRIQNDGPAIADLIVLFPGTTAPSSTYVVIGDLAVGETSAYHDVASGVYRYAAYTYRVQNQTVRQPVIDWMGEKPIDGRRFTYRIALETTPARPQIQLLAVMVDEPSE